MKDVFDILNTSDLPFKVKPRGKQDVFGSAVLALVNKACNECGYKYVMTEQIRAALYRTYKMQKTNLQVANKLGILKMRGLIDRIDKGLYVPKKGV